MGCYKKYKHIDLLWLKTIPEHWDLKRAKTMFEKTNRPVTDSDDTITCFRDGVVTLRKNRRTTGFTESFKEIGYQGIKKGDLVIHQMDAFAGAVGVSDSDGKGTPVYSVCTPKSNQYNNYYYAHLIREMARTGFIQSLYRGIRERSSDFRFDTFSKQSLPIPPRDEQDQIVKFLDLKLSKINKYIKNKKREINLLKEQKRAEINLAVTKGLNPNAPMKVSGISWLGEIPEHWDLKRAKTMFEKTNRPVEEYHETITCFRDGEVTLRKNRRTTGFTESFKEIGYQGIKKGDLVIHQMDAFAGAVGVSDSDGKGTPVYSVCLPKSSDYNNYFYALIIREMANTGFIQSLYRGIRERSSDFRFETFAKQYLPIPARQEQDEILTYINEKTTKIDGFIKKLNQEISLAQEYKISLISEVVSGKVDVRNVKVDEIIEVETLDESDTEVEAEELAEE